MKKLIRRFPLLLITGLVLLSCEKETVKLEEKNDLKIKVEWQTPQGSQMSRSGDGTLKIDTGTNYVRYTFIPTAPCCNANFDFKAPKGMSSGQDSKTGVAYVDVKGAGTWVFTMICICDGIKHIATVTIVVD